MNKDLALELLEERNSPFYKFQKENLNRSLKNKSYIVLTCSNLEEEYRVKQIIEDNGISNLVTIINS